MDFKLVRSSRRRSILFRVGVNGVEVRAPSWVSDQEIGSLVVEKKDWIERAMKEAGSGVGVPADIFSSGGTLYVLGEKYRLSVEASAKGRPSLQEFDQGWRIKGNVPGVRRLLFKWYRLKAEKVFNALVQDWSGRMSVACPKVVVKQHKRLWGSYSGRTKSVNLNFRMAAFPPEIIEYVVIHELCHARHLNHSRLFWDEVFRFCPDWRARRLWLRTSARKYLF